MTIDQSGQSLKLQGKGVKAAEENRILSRRQNFHFANAMKSAWRRLL